MNQTESNIYMTMLEEKYHNMKKENKELWDENEILKAGLTTALTLWNSLEQAGEIKLHNPEIFGEQYHELKRLIEPESTTQEKQS